MGTNYFARVIPSKERKEELKKLIDGDDFRAILREMNRVYGEYKLDYDSYKPEGGEVHLGKRSGGWKFLWNPNIILIRNGHMERYTDDKGMKHSEYVQDPDTAIYLYPLSKKGIKEFIDREDVVVYDEYGEKQDKEKFWKMALE
jgi:hypothetical protein